MYGFVATGGFLAALGIAECSKVQIWVSLQEAGRN